MDQLLTEKQLGDALASLGIDAIALGDAQQKVAQRSDLSGSRCSPLRPRSSHIDLPLPAQWSLRQSMTQDSQ